jgi:hypothetical protein
MKASILATSTAQTVLINPLLIGSKTFLLPLIWYHHKTLPMNHQMHWKENMKMMVTMIICNPAMMHVTCILGLECIVLKLNKHAGCFQVVF